MNLKLYSILLLLILILFSSCMKWLPENRIVGNWKLTDVEKRSAFNNTPITSGYENGVFIFHENGTAVFTDTSGTMNGNWNIRNEQQGYYEKDGNRQNNNGNVLIVKMYNFSSNRVIEWHFDEVYFRSSGKRIQAFIRSPSLRYCYNFRKQ